MGMTWIGCAAVMEPAVMKGVARYEGGSAMRSTCGALTASRGHPRNKNHGVDVPRLASRPEGMNLF